MRPGRSTALLLCLALAGCSTASGPRPPEVHYGDDECFYCRMIISDVHYSCGVVMPDGRTRAYDDLGDLLADRAQNTNGIVWVRDFKTGDWLLAEHAFYVRSPRLKSPMAGNLAAASDRQRAEAIARDFGGTIVDFGSLSRQQGKEKP